MPIIDLRLKLGIEPVRYDSFPVAIVLNIDRRAVGMVADGVSDVVTLEPEQLHPVPEFNSVIESDHLLAVGSVEDRILILVDIERLLSGPDMGLVEPTLQ